MERFWSKVKKSRGCWEWTAGKFESGYGAFSLGGQTERAHRVAWMLTHGELPSLFVLHTCDNPGCVRPSHLELGDQFKNQQDCSKRGRKPVSKLTVKEVKFIRKSTLSNAQLSRKFGVTRGLISKIKLYKSRRSI